jgi:hypothetical protein
MASLEYLTANFRVTLSRGPPPKIILPKEKGGGAVNHEQSLRRPWRKTRF